MCPPLDRDTSVQQSTLVQLSTLPGPHPMSHSMLTCFSGQKPTKQPRVGLPTQCNSAHASRLLVPTVDTQRKKFVVGALVRCGHHALVVGGVGVGKTMTLQSLLEALPADRAHCTINFSAQTSSASLQVREGVCLRM